jgi:hypothetical protein
VARVVLLWGLCRVEQSGVSGGKLCHMQGCWCWGRLFTMLLRCVSNKTRVFDVAEVAQRYTG